MPGTKAAMARRIAVVSAVFVGLVAVLTASWLLRLRRGPVPAEGELGLPGLEAPVTVLRDSMGIPHLWAESEEDLFRAQGWVTASDRLWQMESLRRVAEGRLSEVFGATTLASDRFLRTLGMARAAAWTEAELRPEERRLLEAYVEGVNARIRAWRGALPPEFVLLGVDPEPWTLTQLLSIEKVMAWDLAAYGGDLSVAEARAELADSAFEVVRPGYPAWAPTIVDGWPAGGRADWLSTADGLGPADGAARSGAPLAPPVDPGTLATLARGARAPDAVVPFLEAASISHASNAWVVGPGRSRSGRPLLANDMHLGLDAPPIWYLVGLHAPGLDVVGVSLPGTPGVIAGHNRAVAWGFTNASLDDTDFFVERLDPSDSTRYRTPEGSRPFETRTEIIRIGGRGGEARADTLVVRESRHGPIVSDVGDRAGHELLAVRWAAHDPGRTVHAVLALDRARSAADVVEALRDFTNPHQNVVFADTAGAWGYWMAGRVPIRASGAPPILPVPGWTGEHDWVGVLPFEEHPHVLAPSEGFVVTANNRQSRADGSGRVAQRWADPYRAIRIRELLEASERHDAGSMLAVQMDVGSAFARRHRERAVRAFRDAGLEALADSLAEWDRRADRASRASTLFHRWIEEVRAGERRQLYGSERGYYPRSAVDRSLVEGRVTPEDAVAAARRSADDFVPWGEVHRLSIGHPLGEVPWLGPLFGFGRRDIPRAGSPHTPNVASYGGRSLPFRVTAGPSQRHVVDLGDVDGAGGFVLPGGQSGLPGSPHAWDQLPLWRSGGLVHLPLARAGVQARTLSTLTLVPAATPPP